MIRLAALAMLLVVGCGANQSHPVRPVTPSQLPPPIAAPPGWTVAEGPTEYLPGGLYEYMNGGADRYEGYGFTKLVHTRYQLGDDSLTCVTLDLYDMGSGLGAFGIFAAGRPRDFEPRRWGAEGYRDRTIAAAYQDRVFVRGEADEDRSELLTVLEQLMAETMKGVQGDAAPPAILGHLPVAGRVPNSERFIAADLLGYSFLPGGVLAAYESEGLTDELFFSDLKSAPAAAQSMIRLATKLEQRGAAIQAPTHAEVEFSFNEKLLGSGTVVCAGPFIAGSHGEMNADDRQRILEELTTSLEGVR